MKSTRQRLRRWAIDYGPAILPCLATMAVAFPFAYYAAVQVNGQPDPVELVKVLSWTWYVPEWLVLGLLMVFIAGSLSFIAYWTALKYQIGANVAAVSGVATTATLTWGTQWCDSTGAITVGLTIAGVVIAGAVDFRALEGRGLRKTIEDWWSSAVAKQSSIGTVQFAQISMALYMGAVALISIANVVPAESRWVVLAFSGIGITAASAISEQGKLKNFLAMMGSGIALWGSYVEMDRVLPTGDGDPKAATVLLVAGIVIYVPFTALVLRWRHWVRILIAPPLIAGLAFCITLVATGVPAILASVGCNAKPEHIAVLIQTSGLISVVVGGAAFCIAVWLEIRSRREEAKANTLNINE